MDQISTSKLGRLWALLTITRPCRIQPKITAPSSGQPIKFSNILNGYDFLTAMSLWNENPTSILQIYFPDHFPEWPWFSNNTQQTGNPNKRLGVNLTKFSKTVLKNQFPKIIFRIKICLKTVCIICESIIQLCTRGMLSAYSPCFEMFIKTLKNALHLF